MPRLLSITLLLALAVSAPLRAEVLPKSDQTAENLASLRRSVEYSEDLDQIIQRYQRFIDQTVDSTVQAAAKNDLTLWQTRKQENRIKVGAQWLLPAERQKLLDQIDAQTSKARQFLQAGDIKSADAVLTQAAAVDPENPAVLYLQAFVFIQQDKTPAARKALDALAELLPDHAPTLNNLAVIQWRQNQLVSALGNFDAAMLADPVNKDILDNTAIALQEIPADSRTSKITVKTQQDFQLQDLQLQPRMAALGYHRYGAAWVTDQQLDELHQAQKQNQDKLDALATQFDQSQQRVNTLTQSILDIETQIHRIDAESFYRDPYSGAIIGVTYPPVYSALQQDDARQHQERAQELARMDTLRKSAAALQTPPQLQMPVLTMKLIGPQGTPPATTQPSD